VARVTAPRYRRAVTDRPGPSPFSEKTFYLQEFQGKTLGIVVPDRRSAEHPELARVIDELGSQHTRVVLILASDVPRETLPYPVVDPNSPRMQGTVWRALAGRRAVVLPAAGDLTEAALHVSTRLGLFKLVRVADLAAVLDAQGQPRSFVHRAEIAALRDASSDPRQVALLAVADRLLEAGVENVNICTIEGLGDELFTYSGSGTLFTRKRYVAVRPFGIDSYDAAADLIARGVAEGYLSPRNDEQIDVLLADGFGAFVGGEHLAGIGALRVATSEAGEVASLYTLTRFAGGGIGANLVSHALKRAGELGLAYVYACTTFDRVGAFFERQGFAAVGHDEVPDEKWQGYDPNRKARVRCFRLDL
jgi:amino-acid N-acetyltransferase